MAEGFLTKLVYVYIIHSIIQCKPYKIYVRLEAGFITEEIARYIYIYIYIYIYTHIHTYIDYSESLY